MGSKPKKKKKKKTRVSGGDPAATKGKEDEKMR